MRVRKRKLAALSIGVRLPTLIISIQSPSLIRGSNIDTLTPVGNKTTVTASHFLDVNSIKKIVTFTNRGSEAQKGELILIMSTRLL